MEQQERDTEHNHIRIKTKQPALYPSKLRAKLERTPRATLKWTWQNKTLRGLVKNNWALPHNILVRYCRQPMWLCSISITCHRCFNPKKYPSEASFMVARQLKIVIQIDALTFSATRNLQYVFKKLVCLIVFVKCIFETYLNNIYHIVFSLH